MSVTAAIQQSADMVVQRNPLFLEKAEALKPKLREAVIYPQSIIQVVKDDQMIHHWGTKVVSPADELCEQAFGKGEEVILDFGDHQVGQVALQMRPVGSPPDAPLHLKLTFGEMPVEMAEPFENYNGWISSSWLQEEVIHIDELPSKLVLPRRYSFRYLKLTVLDTSPKYKVAFDEVTCTSVTSADVDRVQVLQHDDPALEAIDRVSIKTLQDCMQDVFEDGPKRDRRLWLGDLRLQALANYETFKSNDLVKRCLYLFAGVPDDRGHVTANLFIKPAIIPDDTFLFDYSLFFLVSLADYYDATKDELTLQELWPTAIRQVEIAMERLDERKIVKDDTSWWSFIDWAEGLNKQAASQAILIYTLKRAIWLAEELGDERYSLLADAMQQLKASARKYLWDENASLFISGKDRQISWASQVWMVLAEVLSDEENEQLLERVSCYEGAIKMATPYMYHHYVDAWVSVGNKERAREEIKAYWGKMVEDGADTFWELYDPNNKEFSPYGSYLINSYCHAWSCTPTYFIRKYGL